APLARFSDEPPWLPTGSRHDRHLIKPLVSVLGAVSATERLNQANDLSSLLEAGLDQRNVNQVRKKGVGRNKHVPARHEYADCTRGPVHEEALQLQPLLVAEHSEAWQGSAGEAIEGRGNPPYSTPTASELRRFFRGVLLKAIWGISHNGVNAVRFPVIEPREAIAMDKFVKVQSSGVMRTRFAHSEGRGVRLVKVVGPIPEGFPEEGKCFTGVFAEDSFDVVRQKVSPDQEFFRFDAQESAQACNHGEGRSRLTALQPGHVSLAHMEVPSEISQRPSPGKARGSEPLPQLPPCGGLSEVDSYLAWLHNQNNSRVYRSSQPSSRRAASRRGSANNGMQRTALRAAAACQALGF
ncbi:hypothetical protein HKBW3S06_01001, partial [Candidatus Hakubella thermalkaliphila]